MKQLSIQNLPLEIKQEILVKWIQNPRDISRFARTCREHAEAVGDAWRQLYIKRFGPLPPTQQSPSCAEEMAQLYKRAHRNSLWREARNFGIVWGNDERYWQFEMEESAQEGQVHEIAKLRHVWWFDVNAEFLGVVAGTYQPCFRVRPFPRPPTTDMMISFSARPSSFLDPAAWQEIYSVPYREMAETMTSGDWTVLRFPPLTLDAATAVFQDVRFYMWDHQSSVKHGFAIDYLSLVPFQQSVEQPQESSISSRAANLISGLASLFSPKS